MLGLFGMLRLQMACQRCCCQEQMSANTLRSQVALWTKGLRSTVCCTGTPALGRPLDYLAWIWVACRNLIMLDSVGFYSLSASGLLRSDFPSGFYWPGLSDFTSWLALDEVLAFWDLEARLHRA